MQSNEPKSQDTAACVSLSKYSIVKEPDKRKRILRHQIKTEMKEPPHSQPNIKKDLRNNGKSNLPSLIKTASTTEPLNLTPAVTRAVAAKSVLSRFTP